MPTTTYVTSTFAARNIGARTDGAGAAVADLAAEEDRLINAILSEGKLEANAFQVRAQAIPDMTVRVGSGAAKVDHYVVAGDVAGQEPYLVRLDVSVQNLTIEASDASQTRTDEIWLVVRDNAYDASARALPQLAVRKGDLGGANPGPDSAWKAAALLARITVAAGVTTIQTAAISDQRATAALLSSLTVPAGTTQSAVIATEESRANTAYGDLATVGPTVTVTVPASGRVRVTVGCKIKFSTGNDKYGYMSFAISGANTAGASETRALILESTIAESPAAASRVFVLTGLAPGATTFTAKYATADGVVLIRFSDREIAVDTLP